MKGNGDHFGVGIISGSIWGSFQGWGSFRGRDHFGGCTDLGDLSNLIGSLSWTIQQYSPPGEWIMCELGVFPIF